MDSSCDRAAPSKPILVHNNEINPLKQLKAWHRLHFRLTLLYGGAILFSLLLLGFIFYKVGTANEFRSMQQRLLATVTSLAAFVDGNTLNRISDHPASAAGLRQRLLDRFQRVAQYDPDIETIYVLLPTDEPTKLQFLVDYAKDGITAEPGEFYDASDLPVMLKGFKQPAVEDKLYADEFGLTLSGYAPIKSNDGKSLALVGADIQAVRIQMLQQRVLAVTAAVFGIAFVLIIMISIFIAWRVRKPLARIINATDEITHGKLDTRLLLNRRDEFGLISNYLDIMAEGLEEREFIRDTFGRYMSADVAKVMLNKQLPVELGGEERVVTVLFSDIQGYTTIAEQLPPVKTVEILNEYLGTMNDVIDDHKGCVIEFFGDAILAVFGAPYPSASHAEQAVRCAMEMRNRLHELNVAWHTSGLSRYWKDHGIDHLKARIGIHTGKVVSGNLGSHRRMKYAVIGDTVNVASRLETLNKHLGTEILISADVRAQLPNDLAQHLVDGGECHIKGREQSMRVYSL